MGGKSNAQWTLEADSLVIHEKSHRGTLVGGSIVLYEDTASPDHRAHPYESVWAFSVDQNDRQYLLVKQGPATDLGNDPFQVDLVSDQGEADWSPRIEFMGLPEMESIDPTGSFTNPSQTDHEKRIENIEVTVATTRPVHVQGNFSFVVYGFDYKVESENSGDRMHRTGEYSSNETGASPLNPDGLIADYTVRVATLDVTNGTLTILPLGWPGNLHLQSVDLAIDEGRLVLPSSEAVLKTDGRWASTQGTLSLEGTGINAEATAPPQHHALSVEFSAREGFVLEDGRPPAWDVTSHDAPTGTLAQSWPWLLAALFSVLLLTLLVKTVFPRAAAPLAAYCVHRSERCIVAGRSGMSWSRIALKLRPDSSEATIAVAAALIKRGRPDKAVPFLESRLRLVGKEDAPMLFSLLAMALEQTGEADEARTAFARALHADPTLREGEMGKWARRRLGFREETLDERYDYA